jgi:hypothetical protein
MIRPVEVWLTAGSLLLSGRASLVATLGAAPTNPYNHLTKEFSCP